ncbi:Hsp20 family protein [Alkalimonas mucilaginosa]|uniref:Hsp20 family protein n=1 Tax=Alkalimonas mucilaginosa TaxID=3057676 RepID=A0ABU7JK63_9GAMM|nr:Hsp20 family protein [Alkalimonas sp. MEB004]MEE2025480.1 Hsp20 family protein [Alkalimonas sp. MEB004]
MNTIDFSPLYRSSIGFDRFASLLDHALRSDQSNNSYPPYNIEVLDENRYAITLAVAGFTQDDLSIEVEQGVLTIKGSKDSDSKEKRQFLHRGIATRSFERKFNLAEFVEVVDASMDHGLLTVSLVKEIPEKMKPKQIAINTTTGSTAIEHKAEKVA